MLGSAGIDGLCPNYALTSLCMMQTDRMREHRDTVFVLEVQAGWAPCACLAMHSAHQYRGFGVRLGDCEGWKQQKVGSSGG